jgi:cyclopropane fatty-acyl-phospholipid synthase-like methyltransferase
MERRALDVLARIPAARRARRVLDIGCGQATYLAGLLTRYRDAHGLGVERDPSVADAARRVLREAEVSRRAEVRVGDFNTLALNTGSYDLALLNNNLHYFAPEERVALFRRIREHLRPGGVLAIQTAVVRESRLSRALGSAGLVATFDLFLRAHRNLHGLPEPAEVEAQLREAGFEGVHEAAVSPDGVAVYLWACDPRTDP